jgi:hypothetical protein
MVQRLSGGRKAADAEAIIHALQDAHANPVERLFSRLGKPVGADDRRESVTGVVIVPEDADAADQAETTATSHRTLSNAWTSKSQRPTPLCRSIWKTTPSFVHTS